jgi:pimeloyl-ACP methyl ester carboxylesterase
MPLTSPRMLRSLAGALAVVSACLVQPVAAPAQSPPCPPGARCGSVTVPLDRANPARGTIDVGYVLLPHTDSSRPAVGAIVPNPGGPGMATTSFAPFYTGFTPLRARHDVLLVDPRGTGRSGALSCPGAAQLDPLTARKHAVAPACAPGLGSATGLYGSAAVADDIDAVRAALGIERLDLWGDSYGTFLMPVYAARHPRHVRSIVLDGAFPVVADPWGRDVLRGMRSVIRRTCHRTRRCSGGRVLEDLRLLARRLHRHPRHFSAHSPLGVVRLRLGERELADVAFAGGRAEAMGWLPGAVTAAVHHDYALLDRLDFGQRVGDVEAFTADPAQVSLTDAAAVECHDYTRPYDLGAPPTVRHRQYRRGLAALDRRGFRPFSPAAWLDTSVTGIDAGPDCLDWPADPTAGSPLRGARLPDVPVLVMSGDLDDNTPIGQGRRAAAQFPRATFAVVADAGHTPALTPCGLALGLRFVRTLHVDPRRCRRAGRAPAVLPVPARRAAELARAGVRAPAGVRRVIGVALATLADARNAAAVSGIGGTLDALRGGTYTIGRGTVAIDGARVVRDAVVDGTRRGPVARLRVHGAGVPRARMALHLVGRVWRVSGTVGGRHVALRVPR